MGPWNACMRRGVRGPRLVAGCSGGRWCGKVYEKDWQAFERCSLLRVDAGRRDGCDALS